jgi:hypothetical protein
MPLDYIFLAGTIFLHNWSWNGANSSFDGFGFITFDVLYGVVGATVLIFHFSFGVIGGSR